ncbi:hypothetical protein JOC70_000015 [Clostridium pascui]|uniref:hypothetical protein n=1 Tax=Clostridium pascui TaxID=46609 RepID=UPI00195884E6|nr:hypothetical protein [Clostridium pascui]MBM7868546.1 hypothetical protein [Clostridium pascui]
MELKITQSKLKSNYSYEIYEGSELKYKALGNRVTPTRLGKVILFNNDGEEVYRVEQEDYLKLLLRLVPIINLFEFSYCPFICYNSKVNEGSIIETNGTGHAYGKINNDKYEVIEISRVYAGIFCNDKQVGLIKRKISTGSNTNSYTLLFNKQMTSELAIILYLLGSISWHNFDNSYSSPTEIIIGSKKEGFDENWLPED